MDSSAIGKQNVVFEFNGSIFFIDDLFVHNSILWNKNKLNYGSYSAYWRTTCYLKMNQIPMRYVPLKQSIINSNLFEMDVDYAGFQTEVHFLLQDLKYSPVNHKRAIAVFIT